MCGVGGGEEGHTQEHTQERTRKCCTYPLATYPLKSARLKGTIGAQMITLYNFVVSNQSPRLYSKFYRVGFELFLGHVIACVVAHADIGLCVCINHLRQVVGFGGSLALPISGITKSTNSFAPCSCGTFKAQPSPALTKSFKQHYHLIFSITYKNKCSN